MSRPADLAPWILIAAGLVACGDDDPTGAAGGGGSGGATTTSTTTGTTTASAQGGGGAGPGGGDTGPGGGDTGGAGGEGGEGGGAAAIPHPVEIAYSVADAGADLGHVHVLVNEADGALVAMLTGDELPTTVDVLDGQIISFVDGSTAILSHRVTPELARIDRGSSLGATVGCEMGAPMNLAVTVEEEVPGAVVYRAQTGYGGTQERTSPGTFEIPFDTCTSVATIDVLITAEAADGTVLGLEALRDVPYVPGAASEHSVTLPLPARAPLSFAISGVDGMERVTGYAEWVTTDRAYLKVSEESLFLDEVPTTDAIDYAPLLVAPGFGTVIAQVRATWPADGDACVRSQITRVGGSEETLAFDARGLRAPTLVGDDDVGWIGDGEAGSIVYRSFGYGGSRTWSLFEDPARSSGPAVFPVMPEHLQGLAPAPSELELRRIGHYALEGAPYAAYLAGGAEDGLGKTSRATVWRRCTD